MNGIYLALGDSITAGYGVGVNESFAYLVYLNLLPSYPGLKYSNHGINGLTSGELASMLGQNQYDSLIRQSKVISITIGANDLLAIGRTLISGVGQNIDYSLENFNHNLRLIGERIRSVNLTGLIKIATIYNPLPPMNIHAEDIAQRLVNTANQSIIRVAREFGLIVVPVKQAFDGREKVLLGSDQLHPNVMGHRMLANLFLQAN